MALFRGIQEYIALDANNIARVEDEGNIVSIEGNVFLYPPKKSHPILYNYPLSLLMVYVEAVSSDRQNKLYVSS